MKGKSIIGRLNHPMLELRRDYPKFYKLYSNRQEIVPEQDYYHFRVGFKGEQPVSCYLEPPHSYIAMPDECIVVRKNADGVVKIMEQNFDYFKTLCASTEGDKYFHIVSQNVWDAWAPKTPMTTLMNKEESAPSVIFEDTLDDASFYRALDGILANGGGHIQ